jgi:hypothetical protein
MAANSMTSMGVISGSFASSADGKSSDVVVTGLGNKTSVFLAPTSGVGANVVSSTQGGDLTNFTGSANASSSVGTTASATATTSTFQSDFVQVLTSPF